MKKYDEYKDSGVAWIGKVPKHWEVIPFKRAMTIYNGSDYKHIQVEIAGYPVIGSGGEFARASQYVYDGEVVLLGRKGTIDKPMYYNGKFWTVDTMFYAIPKKHVNCKYLYYQALIIPFERYATSTALPSMTQTDLNLNIISLPSTVEQVAIADYLDTHCAKIDNLISIQQKRIALLQELKQSVITHAVTKGLNPNVEMKQSGVEWIGDVPKHWEVMPLKFTGTFGNGLTYSPKDVVDNGILVLRSSNIQNSSLSFEDNVYVSKVSRDLLVKKGDIIICSRNGSAALVGKSAFVDKELNATFGAFMMRYIPNIEKKYGFYLFQTAIGQYKGYFSTTTINQLTKTTIDEIKVPLAMAEEQAAIASYLDHKCATIDTSISNAQHQIELLQEYKQSLITEVVTGKRKVTDN